jgi:hypothetical protein
MYDELFDHNGVTLYKNGVKVYDFDQEGLFINVSFIFGYLLKKFSFDTQCYQFSSDWLILSGFYNKQHVIPIKKFFYDEFPLVKKVIFSKSSIRIEFLTEVNFVSRNIKI